MFSNDRVSLKYLIGASIVGAIGIVLTYPVLMITYDLLGPLGLWAILFVLVYINHVANKP